MTSPLEARIAVIGAGLGGLACARTLQKRGLRVTVFEREASFEARWQGGILDLHVPTGQSALRTAGVVERFAELARPEGQELRVLDPFDGHTIVHERPEPGQFDAPEIDRGQLRGLLVDSLQPGTVQWGRTAKTVSADPSGRARIRFSDIPQDTADFDLVIGADGARSRTRRALSDAEPEYIGTTFVGNLLDDLDTRHPELAELIGQGSLQVQADDVMLLAARNAQGQATVFVSLRVPEDWEHAAGLDIADTEGVRQALLAKLEGWDSRLTAFVRDSDSAFNTWPLFILPVGHRWDHVVGITLLGDAAHLMPPYGIGANLALLDGTDLATAIADSDDLDDAVRAYESVMLPRGADAARACAELTEAMAGGAAAHAASERLDLNERTGNWG